MISLTKWWRDRKRRAELERAPKTLDEAVDQMIAAMTEDDKARFRQEDPKWPGIGFHFGGGMAMRNEWGLWEHITPLGQQFLANGVWHGDDRSACVYKALYARLTGQPFDLAAQGRFYRAWWTKRYGPACVPDIVCEKGVWQVCEKPEGAQP